jgi:hypothetical protein
MVLESDPEYLGGISRTINYYRLPFRYRGAPLLLKVAGQLGERLFRIFFSPWA